MSSFYGQSKETESMFETSDCIIIVFAQSEYQVIYVKRNGSYLLE